MAIRRPWSAAEARAAGAAFHARTGGWPTCADLHPASGLPSYNSVKDLFGNLAGYHQALGAPQDTPRPPAPPRPPTRPCLRCDAPFASPHHGVRLCDACKRDPDWHDASGAWMNATPIVER